MNVSIFVSKEEVVEENKEGPLLLSLIICKPLQSDERFC